MNSNCEDVKDVNKAELPLIDIYVHGLNPYVDNWIFATTNFVKHSFARILIVVCLMKTDHKQFCEVLCDRNSISEQNRE